MLKAEDAKQTFENPMSQKNLQTTYAEDWFVQKLQLAIDPYFEREFFTNVIHCMDRKKSIRDVLSVAVQELDAFGGYDTAIDSSLLHLLTCYQASSDLRESYQWLPIFQGLFTLALFRGDGRRPLPPKAVTKVDSSAGKIDDFIFSIGKDARRVGNYEQAWSHLLFALENRSQRSAVCEALTVSSMSTEDPLTFCLLMKSLDICFASAWKKNAIFLKRAFARFWHSEVNESPHSVLQAQGLVASSPKLTLSSGVGVEFTEAQGEEVWTAITQQSPEAAWEMIQNWSARGVSFDQWMSLCQLFRGRLLYTMRPDQWPLVFDSLQYANALESASRWDPTRKLFYLAVNICDLASTSKKINTSFVFHPNADSVLSGLSKNISKNQLVLRLDDACEKGDRQNALDLLALILDDRGLTNSVSDRLVLMACKQDAWTYERSSIPFASTLTKAYLSGVRMSLPDKILKDALFGLLRFLSDQRQNALEETRKRGDYGDGGLSKSPFDVSGGARIVDRFVFNQVRNAQRIQIWPSEGKG